MNKKSDESINLQKEVETKKAELNTIKMQIFLEKEKNKNLLKTKKKEIARLLTKINSQ
tara:strand:+ start:4513 stop:4686 length:174 start_codon:yes stop_codon:yes gene_type:complete